MILKKKKDDIINTGATVRAAALLFDLIIAFSSFFQALNDAKRELRYLLVYLHGDDHQDTDEFCRFELC